MTRNKALVGISIILLLCLWVISRVYLSEQKSSAINNQTPFSGSLGNPEEWKTNVEDAKKEKPKTWRDYVTIDGKRAYIPLVDKDRSVSFSKTGAVLSILNDFEKEYSVTIKSWVPYVSSDGPTHINGLWIDFEPNPKQ